LIAGPAAYDPKVEAMQKKGGKMVVKEKRFRQPKSEDVPGPGTYEVRNNRVFITFRRIFGWFSGGAATTSLALAGS